MKFAVLTAMSILAATRQEQLKLEMKWVNRQ